MRIGAVYGRAGAMSRGGADHLGEAPGPLPFPGRSPPRLASDTIEDLGERSAPSPPLAPDLAVDADQLRAQARRPRGGHRHIRVQRTFAVYVVRPTLPSVVLRRGGEAGQLGEPTAAQRGASQLLAVELAARQREMNVQSQEGHTRLNLPLFIRERMRAGGGSGGGGDGEKDLEAHV